MSYAQLQACADWLAQALQSRSIGPGDVVAVCLPPSPTFGAALLGVLGAGAAFLVLDPNDPAARQARLAKQAGARLVITDAALASRFDSGGTPVLDFDGIVGPRDGFGPSQPPHLQDAPAIDDLAYVIFTSGSTGTPKGVLISHGALTNHCHAVAHRYQLRPDDRSVQLAPLGFDVVLEELFPIWLTGGRVHFPTRGGALSLTSLTRCVVQEQISVLNMAASYWHEWVDHLERSRQTVPPSVRLVICGSERVSTGKLRQW